MPTLAAHAARRHEPPTQKSTKQTPAHAAASNFACTLLLTSLLMHCWHIVAAAALSSPQQTHDALRGALRGGTWPTAHRPHRSSINISSFSPRCHTRQHNRSIVNFDFFLLAPHLDMSDDEIVFDVTNEDGAVEQERVRRDETELDVRFSFFSFRRPHASPFRRSWKVGSSSPCPTTSRS